MQLSDYLKSKNLTEAEFGELIGKSQAAINRYCSGKRMPGRDTLAQIAAVTKGRVQPNDFVLSGGRA
jgi:transcriptional regulator with XRE-family HTH domain